MKNRINFYFDELRPHSFLINPSFIMLLWVIALIVVVVFSSQSSVALSNAELALEQANQDISEKRNLVTSLNADLERREQDAALLASIERSQSELDLKRGIIDELDSRGELKSSGYATMMLDLAKVHQEGVWLTRIHLDENNVRIEGAASDSTALPKWVNSLHKASFFRGAKFAETRMFRDEEEQLYFVLNSHQETEATEQGGTK